MYCYKIYCFIVYCYKEIKIRLNKNKIESRPKSDHSNNYIIKQSKHKIKRQIDKICIPNQENCMQESLLKYRDRDRLKIKGW